MASAWTVTRAFQGYYDLYRRPAGRPSRHVGPAGPSRGPAKPSDVTARTTRADLMLTAVESNTSHR